MKKDKSIVGYFPLRESQSFSFKVYRIDSKLITFASKYFKFYIKSQSFSFKVYRIDKMEIVDSPTL